MSKSKRVTSHELIEIRTVISRAKTALAKIDAWRSLSSADRFAYDHPIFHDDHEVSMMRSALGTAIDVLEKVELAHGYRDA